MALHLLDETGNDGNSPWNTTQHFYSHGVVKIEAVSEADLTQAARQCLTETGVDNLHMRERTTHDKVRIVQWVANYLSSKDWSGLEYHIEKSFYPASVLSDIIFLPVVRKDNGNSIKEDQGYASVLNLLSNIHFSKEVCEKSWRAILSRNWQLLYDSIVQLHVESSEKSSVSGFCESVAIATDKISNESDVYQKLIDSRKFHPDYRSFKSKSFLSLMRHIERNGWHQDLPIYHDESSELRRLLRVWRREIHDEIPSLAGVVFPKDKNLFFIVDVLMWVAKEYHIFERSNIGNLGVRHKPVISEFIRVTKGAASNRISGGGVSKTQSLKYLQSGSVSLPSDSVFIELIDEYNSLVRRTTDLELGQPDHGQARIR